MVTEFNIDKRWGFVSLETDDWCLNNHELSKEVIEVVGKWDFRTKRRVNVRQSIKVNYFSWLTETGYAFPYTQFPIVLNEYLKVGMLTETQYNEYMKEYSLDIPELPQTLGKMTMYDNQMEILNDLMHRRFGLCHVFTGFGKTEMIAYMCKYYRDVLNWNVLITAPNAKVLEEIVLRVNSKLETEIGVNYPNDSGILAINAASVSKQSYNHRCKEYAEFLSSIKVVLSDEAEACLSPTHLEIYSLCKNRECMYGFSATPDCYCGNLSYANGVTEAMYRSKKLLDNFGGSIVNLTPEGFDIEIISFKIRDWDLRDQELLAYRKKWIDSKFDWSIYESIGDLRNRIDNDLFLNPVLPPILSKISKSYPNTVITINRTQIIDYWISQLPDLKIFEISGRGYRVHYQGEIRKISLDELKEYYLMADLILGSKSLIRGIDLPELHTSVQLSGRKSGSTIQSIGRTARKRSMRVIILETGKYVPGYSNQNKSRIALVKSQYPPELNNITEFNSEV